MAKEVLQDDANFLVEKIDWQGKPAVRKSAKPSAPQTRINRLRNDVLGMNFFEQLTKDHPGLELYVPKVYDSSPEYYVREYIESQCLLEEAATFEQSKQRLDKLIKLLAAIDRIEPKEQIGYVGSSNWRNLEQSIPRWAAENITDELISAEEGARAKELSQDLSKYLQPRIAHGDMSAYKHSYLTKNGQIALIDFENFATGAARYFDVAWTYTRLYSFAVTTEIPKYFLTNFIAMAEPVEHQAEQLFAVILQRTLGMQKDAQVDVEKGLHYESRAKELLELVLQGELRPLYD